jgi:hypothetical protein
MKRELLRCFRRKTTYVVLYLEIIIFVALVVYSSKTIVNKNNIGNYLGKYDSKEELEKLYNEEKQSFDDNRDDYLLLGLDLQPIYDRFEVYMYMLNHYEDYRNVALYSEAEPYATKDSLGTMFTYEDYTSIILLVFSAFLAAYIFSADFTGKRHVFLYVGRNRLKIVWEKFLSFLIIILINFMILFLIGAFFNYISSTHIKKVLVMTATGVKEIPFWLSYILDNIGMLVLVIIYSLAFYSIAVLTKNEIATGIGSLIYFAVIQFANYLIVRNMLDASPLGSNPLYYVFSDNGNLSTWLLVAGIELIVISFLAFIGCLKFKSSRL